MSKSVRLKGLVARVRVYQFVLGLGLWESSGFYRGMVNDDGTDAGSRGYFWVPRTALVAYAGYIALLFSVGQYYPLFPWVLTGAVLLGALALYIVAQSVRAAPRSRPWFSTTSYTGSRKRPGFGNLVLITLIGPAPFLMTAALQEWLVEVGWSAGWVLMASATAVFVVVFGGYCLVEAVLNRRAERVDSHGP